MRWGEGLLRRYLVGGHLRKAVGLSARSRRPRGYRRPATEYIGLQRLHLSENMVLITNADDYGLTAGTNRGIERAHAAGTLSSTSVMVNQSASEDAGSLNHRYPALGVGLHLTFTLGEPVSDPARVHSLVDADGRLVNRAALLRRLERGTLDDEEMAHECTAQLDRLRSFGVEPDHWNMHQHMQEYAPIGIAAGRAMAAAGLRVARNPQRVRTHRTLSRAGLTDAVRDRRRQPGCRAVAAYSRTPDGLLEAHPAQWSELVNTLSGDVFEAICHPSEPDEALGRLTPDLTLRRVEELDALLAPELASAFQTQGIALTTFAAAFRL
jgi:chitin disaccharide deacetylase